MGTKGLVRLFRRAVAAQGLEEVSCRRGAGHQTVRLRNKHGLEMTFPLPNSPSDGNVEQAWTKQLARFARALTYEEYTR